MNKEFFSDDVRKLGSWELTLNSQVDILAYFLYLNEVKKLKDSGEWIKLESTLVLDQIYFSKSKTGEYYYSKAINMIRNKKLKNVKKK
jgi:hypothetical protein